MGRGLYLCYTVMYNVALLALIPIKSHALHCSLIEEQCIFEKLPCSFSLHKCSGLDSPDEEFVWNGGSSETINNRLLSRGYHANRSTGKPLLAANHHHLRFGVARRWQNLAMAHWYMEHGLIHITFKPYSSFDKVLWSRASSRPAAMGARICETGRLHRWFYVRSPTPYLQRRFS